MVLATLVMFAQLGRRELWSSHEARAAQEAHQFLTTKSWGVHHLFDGSNDYQKPPLYYWLVAGAAWLRGGIVDNWAVRFPAALAGWLTVLAISVYLQWRGRPTAGLIAGVALTTTCHYLAISRTGRIDLPLTAAVTFGVLCGWEGKWISAGLAMAVGALLKGPIGILLPLVVIVSTEWLVQQCRWSKHLGSTLIAIVMAAPWFLYAGWETDWQFWRVFFWHHNLDRAAGSADNLASHPLWFYPARWLIDWLPWSPLLVYALWKTIPRGGSMDFEARMGLVWMVSATLLLTLAQFKRADYLIPAYPGAAILLGCQMERYVGLRMATHRHRWELYFGGIVAFSVMTYAFVDHWNLRQEPGWYPQKEFARQMRANFPPDRPIILFRVEDHLLAWHLKPPLISVNEWENLEVWIARNGVGGVIMSPKDAAQWSQWVGNGTLQEVARMKCSGPSSPRAWVALRSQVSAQHE
jgi:4-amino-4-deoxy-L-arabinose transferase-like glycosyltransferase